MIYPMIKTGRSIEQIEKEFSLYELVWLRKMAFEEIKYQAELEANIVEIGMLKAVGKMFGKTKGKGSLAVTRTGRQFPYDVSFWSADQCLEQFKYWTELETRSLRRNISFNEKTGWDNRRYKASKRELGCTQIEKDIFARCAMNDELWGFLGTLLGEVKAKLSEADLIDLLKKKIAYDSKLGELFPSMQEWDNYYKAIGVNEKYPIFTPTSASPSWYLTKLDKEGKLKPIHEELRKIWANR